ncbi:hypothetical protein VTK73DRAFT_3994 [Phialemonium thermophilum]|uniref:Uncharacterized protein n=1 Tax=Phialemonium thermophilum TaxID=223376 RepID=A0ABR3WVW8_9PEZI
MAKTAFQTCARVNRPHICGTSQSMQLSQFSRSWIIVACLSTCANQSRNWPRGFLRPSLGDHLVRNVRHLLFWDQLSANLPNIQVLKAHYPL